ncbi:MAG: NAD(P)/FAD-dependent oxidoreductase, partial [Hymenobacter sp.]
QGIIREHENPAYLRQQGLTVEIGLPEFAGEREVRVNGRLYRGRRIVVATGSRPRPLQVPGAEAAPVYTNQHVWDVRQLPARLLVVGGGPNGVELAQALQRLGSQVTLVHRGRQLLDKEDPAIAAVLLARLRAEGLVVHLDCEVQAFPTPREARVKPASGEPFTVGLDMAYVAIGREVSFEGLHLGRAGVAVDDKGHLKLNDYLQTTNPHVFAAGDAANSLKFSHAAELHMRLLLHNFFSPLKKKLSYQHFSWVTFTDPEVAHFGLDEKQLQQRGAAYERWETTLATDDRAVVDDARDGRLLLFVEKNRLPFGKRRLLGGAMVASHAGELIQELVLANAQGLGIQAFFDKVYAYPVAARINQELVVQHSSIPPLAQLGLRLAYRW